MHCRRLDSSQRQMSSSTWMCYHRNGSIPYILSFYISVYISLLCVSMSVCFNLSHFLCPLSIPLSPFSSLKLILGVANLLLNICVSFVYPVSMTVSLHLSPSLCLLSNSLHVSFPFFISEADSFSDLVLY